MCNMEGKLIKFDFKFGINLQRICIIKIVTTLWERKETKQRIELFFQKFYKRYDEQDSNSTKWNNVTKSVLDLLKDFSLPVQVNNTLRHLIKVVGLQVYNWTKYVTKVLKFDFACAENIFWNNNGTIDKVRIFENWFQNRLLEPDRLFNMACIFCLEEYIPILWQEIPDDMKNNEFYSDTIYTVSKYNLIAYWKNSLIDEARQNFISSMAETERGRNERLKSEGHFLNDELNERRIDWLYIFANSESIEENMFRVSVFEGLELGVKYFWQKLNDEQEERNIYFALHTAQRKSDEPEYAEILIFLMTKLSIEQNISLLYDEFFLLELLLQNWPWEEFLMQVLDRVLDCYENSSERDVENYEIKFFYLIHAIVDMMKSDFALYDCIEGSPYQLMLQETWEKIPESAKILVAGKRDSSIISKLLNLEDFSTLRLIINYEGFRGNHLSKRKSMISCVKSLFVYLKVDKKEPVEKFVNEIGFNEDEKEKLRAEFFYSLCLI